jgi:hypothetical protein
MKKRIQVNLRKSRKDKGSCGQLHFHALNLEEQIELC